jgi:hypothetical protein
MVIPKLHHRIFLNGDMVIWLYQVISNMVIFLNYHTIVIIGKVLTEDYSMINVIVIVH